MISFPIALLAALLSSPSLPADCSLDQEKADWMSGTLALWQEVSRESLHLAEREQPLVIFFNEQCIWKIGSSPAGAETAGTFPLSVNGKTLSVRANAHDGMIPLPGGGEIPPQLILFASAYGEQRLPYHVMPLPSIWRQAPHHANEDVMELNELIRSVFVHEMSHTQQAHALGDRIDAITAAEKLGEDVNDDIVQTRFESNAQFSQLIENERDLLYRAVATPDKGDARRLAAEALETVRLRHARFYGESLDWLRELEDVFLYMEGAANWAAYQALLAQGVSPEDALPRMRRGGRYWSQDIGLALFLVIDRLHSGWQETAFGPEPGSVLDLLEAGIRQSK